MNNLVTWKNNSSLLIMMDKWNITMYFLNFLLKSNISSQIEQGFFFFLSMSSIYESLVISYSCIKLWLLLLPEGGHSPPSTSRYVLVLFHSSWYHPVTIWMEKMLMTTNEILRSLTGKQDFEQCGRVAQIYKLPGHHLVL